MQKEAKNVAKIFETKRATNFEAKKQKTVQKSFKQKEAKKLKQKIILLVLGNKAKIKRKAMLFRYFRFEVKK